MIALPKGPPYVRVEGTGIQLDVLGQRLSGDFAFEKATDLGLDGAPGGTGLNLDVTIIRVGATNVSLSLGGATPLITVTGGAGAFFITPAGIAGRVQGAVTVNVPDVSLAGTLEIQFNNTNLAVNQTILFGSSPITLALPIGPYIRLAGTGIDLNVLGQTLRGDFEITKAPTRLEIKVSHATLKLGGTLANPILTVSQTGVATFVLTPFGIAGSLSASVALAVPGVSFTGAFAVSLNTMPVPAAGLPAGPYLRVESASASLTVLGQLLTGSFSLEQVTTALGLKAVKLAVSGISVSLAGGLVSVHQGFGLFVITPQGIGGTISAAVGVSVPGISLGGTFALSINTTGLPVAQSLKVGNATISVNLPSGPYVRLEGIGVRLDVLGQRLSGDFAIEQITVGKGLDGLPGTFDDLRAVKISIAHGSLSLGDGTKNFLSLTNGQGAFLLLPVLTVPAIASITSAGVGGGGTLTRTTGSWLSAGLTVGRRVEITGLTGSWVVGSVSALELELVGTDVLATAPSAPLILTSLGGFTGRIGATVALQNVPDVSLSGDLKLEINTTGSAVDQTFVVGGFPSRLQLDAGVYVRVIGEGVGLTVAGQQLSGNFSFERDTTVPTAPVIRVSFSEVELGLGDGTRTFVRVTQGQGDLVLLSTGIYGRFGGSVAVDVPDVTFTGAFQIKLNTTDLAQDLTGPTETLLAHSFRIEGLGVTLTIAGQQIGADGFVVESNTTAGVDGVLGGLGAADDETIVSIALDNLTLQLGAPGDPFIDITAANDLDGAILINGLGLAATFSGSVTPGTFTLPPGMGLTATTFAIEINTGPVPVDTEFLVGLDTITLDVPAGPFFRVRVDGADLCLGAVGGDCVGATGPSFSGNFTFDQSQKSGFDAGSEVDAVLPFPAVNAVVAGDVDQDGDLDLVLGIDGKDKLYLNTCSPTPDCVSQAELAGTDLFDPGSDDTRGLALVDVDGDGFLDLVATNNGSTGTVYLNKGTITSSTTVTWRGFAAGVGFGSSSAATSVATGDVNGDGHVDVVVGVSGAAGELYLNGGSSTVRASASGSPDGVQFTGSATFMAASGAFTVADQGRLIDIAGTTYRIIARTSATAVVLDRAAETTGGMRAWSIHEWGGFALSPRAASRRTSPRRPPSSSPT